MSQRTMAAILIDEASAWGVRLERRPTEIAIIPAGKAPDAVQGAAPRA